MFKPVTNMHGYVYFIFWNTISQMSWSHDKNISIRLITYSLKVINSNFIMITYNIKVIITFE